MRTLRRLHCRRACWHHPYLVGVRFPQTHLPRLPFAGEIMAMPGAVVRVVPCKDVCPLVCFIFSRGTCDHAEVHERLNHALKPIMVSIGCERVCGPVAKAVLVSRHVLATLAHEHSSYQGFSYCKTFIHAIIHRETPSMLAFICSNTYERLSKGRR